MAIPLIVLAIGSVFAGYVGVPHALGGSNRIERFLEPSFEAAPLATTPASADGAPSASAALTGAVTQEPAHAEPAAQEEHQSDERTELLLMGVSSVVAVVGILIAMYFWLRNLSAADAMARRFSAFYKLLLNKYYVDEIYDAAIVQPTKLLSTGGLWKGIDVGLIDGIVNGVGQLVTGTSSVLRRIQNGSVRTYAASLFLGGVLILGWYLWS